MEVLSGHTSPETAVTITDYPYGFRLRCQIRYWLEYRDGHGYRFVSQTTNPKKAGEVWNKPKPSTYCRLGGVMLRNEENGHITWTGLTEYDDTEKCARFLATYGEVLPAEGRKYLERIVFTKREYEAARAAGQDMKEAYLSAAAAWIKHVKGALNGTPATKQGEE